MISGLAHGHSSRPWGCPEQGRIFASATDNACGVLLLAAGDHDDNIDVNTTDIFTFTAPSFSRLAAMMNFAPSRRHSSLVMEPQSRTLMLFAGLHDPSQVLADTWLYRLGACSR